MENNGDDVTIQSVEDCGPTSVETVAILLVATVYAYIKEDISVSICRPMR